VPVAIFLDRDGVVGENRHDCVKTGCAIALTAPTGEQIRRWRGGIDRIQHVTINAK
jgi:hypothetical protein